MTDQTNQTPAIEVIPWYKSSTIWSALVSAICGLVSVSGHTIDAGTQSQLAMALYNVAGGVAVLASFAAAHFRTKTNATIKPIVKKPDSPQA